MMFLVGHPESMTWGQGGGHYLEVNHFMTLVSVPRNTAHCWDPSSKEMQHVRELPRWHLLEKRIGDGMALGKPSWLHSPFLSRRPRFILYLAPAPWKLCVQIELMHKVWAWLRVDRDMGIEAKICMCKACFSTCFLPNLSPIAIDWLLTGGGM